MNSATIDRTKFEYRTDGFSPYGDKTLTWFLNECGDQGWQLVGFETIRATAAYNSVHYQCVWMRPLIDAAYSK